MGILVAVNNGTVSAANDRRIVQVVVEVEVEIAIKAVTMENVVITILHFSQKKNCHHQHNCQRHCYCSSYLHPSSSTAIILRNYAIWK